MEIRRRLLQGEQPVGRHLLVQPFDAIFLRFRDVAQDRVNLVFQCLRYLLCKIVTFRFVELMPDDLGHLLFTAVLIAIFQERGNFHPFSSQKGDPESFR